MTINLGTDEQREEYAKLSHALQTGVAYHQAVGISPDNLRNLRVGINMALCELAVVESILISKGIVTEDEYWETRLAWLRKEVERYEQQLAEFYGRPVTLG